MTNTSTPGGTPENVAGLATTPKVLEQRGLALIGLTGSAGSFRALVRLPGGQIRQVEPGTRLAQGTVMGIDAEGLVLQHNGKTQRLALPGG